MNNIARFVLFFCSLILLISCNKEEHINKNLKFNNIQNAVFVISVEGYNYQEGDLFAVSVYNSSDTNTQTSLMQMDLNGELKYLPNILRLNKEYFASTPAVEIVSNQGMTDVSCRIVAENKGQPFYINIETWINKKKVKDEKRLLVDEANSYNATFTYFN